MNKTKNKGVYLYCLTNSPLEIEKYKNMGVSDSEPYFLQYKELYVVASNAYFHEFEGHVTEENVDWEWLEEKTNAHNALLLAVMEDHDILPISFGTVLPSKNKVHDFLEDNCQKFFEALDYLQGCTEWNLEIKVDEEELEKKIEREKDEVRELKNKISSVSEAMAHMYKKQLSTVKEDHKEKLINEVRDKLQRHIGELPLENKKPERSELLEKKGNIIVGRTYLIKEEKRKTFIQRLKTLDQKAGKAFTLKLVGPWPVYSFVPKAAKKIADRKA